MINARAVLAVLCLVACGTYPSGTESSSGFGGYSRTGSSGTNPSGGNGNGTGNGDGNPMNVDPATQTNGGAVCGDGGSCTTGFCCSGVCCSISQMCCDGKCLTPSVNQPFCQF
jgi:hypothetical protein